VIVLVPLDDDVTIVLRLTSSAEARPESVPQDRPLDEGSAELVEHGVAYVHPFHDLSIAHGGVGVGRYKGKTSIHIWAAEIRSIPDPHQSPGREWR
jgi:hypothetical protein